MSLLIEFAHTFMHDPDFILWRFFLLLATPLWLVERTVLSEWRQRYKPEKREKTKERES